MRRDDDYKGRSTNFGWRPPSLPVRSAVGRIVDGEIRETDAKAVREKLFAMFPVAATYIEFLKRDEVLFLLWRLRLSRRFKRRMGAEFIRELWRKKNLPATRRFARNFSFGERR